MADGLVTIAVELEDGSVVRGVADLKNQFSGFDGVTKRSSLGMMTFGAAAGLAMSIVSKAFDTVKQSVGAAVSRFDTLNQFPKVMKQMGYSAEDTAVATKILKKGIDGLPTSLSEITKSAQSFSILTGSAEKGAKTSLALNDAFLASGASAEDASRGVQQYSQMLSSGKVDMMSWRTLLETMPYSLNEVAKAFGFTGKAAQNDLYNALQNGSITMDQLNDKFIELDGGTKGFAKTARVASEGIKTSFTNMNNAVVAGLANTLKAIDDGLKNSNLPGIAQILNDRKDQITSTFKTINGVITASIPPIVNTFRSLFNFINANKDWIYPLVVGIATGVIAFTTLKTAMQIGTAMSLFVKSIKSGVETMQILWMIMMDNPIILLISVIAALAAGLTYFFTKTETGRQAWAKFVSFLQSSIAVIVAAFQKFIAITSEAFENFKSKYGDAFQSFMSTASETFQGFKTIVSDAFGSFISFISPAIAAIKSWLNSLQPAGGIFAGISGPMGTVIGLVEKFGPLIISMIAPIGLMGKLLLQFTAAFIQTGNASSAITLMASNFTDLVVNVLNGLTTIINGLTAILPTIVEAGVNIITSLISGLLGALPQIIQAATQIITLLVNAIGTALPAIILAGIQIINMLVQAITEALPQLVEAGIQIINMLVQSFTEALPMIIESAVTIMTTLLNGIIAVLPMLIGAALQIIMALGQALIAALPMLLDAGLQIIMSLGQAIIAALPALIDAALQIILALVNALIVNLPQIINAGIQLLTALINGIIVMLPLLINAAIQIIMALVNGIIQNLPAIITAAVQLIMALVNGLIQNLPAIISAGIQLIMALANSIIQLVPLLLQAGVQLIMALITGIGSLLGQVVQAGAKLITQMLSRIGSFLGNMGSMGANLINSLIGGISSMIGNVASTVSSGISRAVSSVRGFAGDMASAAGYMASGLVKGIEDKIGAVVNAAKNMGKKAVDAVKSFLNIHSPSRVMRDEVGKYISLGVAVGIDKYSDRAVESMESMAGRITAIKPEATVDMGSKGGFNQAKNIIKHQVLVMANNKEKYQKPSNTANISIQNVVRDNPSEAEQARQFKNTMRQAGYDLVY